MLLRFFRRIAEHAVERQRAIFLRLLKEAAEHVREGKYEKALRLYQRIRGSETAYGAGGCLYKLGRIDEARYALERCLSLQPDFTKASDLLATLPPVNAESQALGAVTVPRSRTLGLLVAAPNLFVAGSFLVAWVFPAWFGVQFVASAPFLMVIELLVVGT